MLNDPIRVPSLLILADDLTGALDTGVRLAAQGLRVYASTGPDNPEDIFTSYADVLVADTETRHRTAEETYMIVSGLVRKARQRNIPHLYIKTDSAMRGNIGASFRAALDASGEARLSFVPAFPQMDRVVRNGILYVNGLPLAESGYAADPLHPLKTSDIAELIDAHCDVPVRKRRLGSLPGTAGPDPLCAPVIDLWDTESVSDLSRISAQILSEGNTRLSAGCAGFAAFLSGIAGLKTDEKEKETADREEMKAPLTVLCGSVNPASRSQTALAADAGFSLITFTPEEKYSEGFFLLAKNNARLREILSLAKEGNAVIGSASFTDEDEAFLRANSLSYEEGARRTASSIGIIFKCLLDEEPLPNLLVTGGDTLKACLDAAQITGLSPLFEIETGVAVSAFSYRGRTCRIISKSGGFGNADLFVKINRKAES